MIFIIILCSSYGNSYFAFYLYTAISSGAMHVRVLGMDGRIFEWGKIWQDNKWNELQPRFVSGNLEGKTVTQIACGHLHSLALTEEGEVYSWGHDNYGQLGIGRHSTETEPVKVSGSNGFESEIVSVACAGWTSFALDFDGNVSWHTPQVICSNCVNTSTDFVSLF